MTQPRIYWLQAQQDAAPAPPPPPPPPPPGTAPRVYWMQVLGVAAPPPPPPPPPPSAAPRIYWAQINDSPVVLPPPAPGGVVGEASGGTTALITVQDTSSGSASHRVQVRVVGGAWADAAGVGANPMSPGTVEFLATGLPPAAQLEAQVRAERAGLNSAYVPAAAWWQDNVGTGGGEIPAPTGATATLAFVEVGDDAVVVLAVRLRNATLAFAETGDDTVLALATLRQTYQAALSFAETQDDSVSVLGAVRLSVQALLQHVDEQDDLVAIAARVAASFTARVAFAEEGADEVAVQGVVATSRGLPGTLAALASEYVELRSASGLFIGYPEVLSCAIKATRFYAGWAAMSDTATGAGPFSVTGDTFVTNDEWAIISPLFHLYCDRENAVVIEASAASGLPPMGKSSSEVSSEILQVEEALPLKAYVEPAWSIGFPPAT
jgi:hypothetical protein